MGTDELLGNPDPHFMQIDPVIKNSKRKTTAKCHISEALESFSRANAVPGFLFLSIAALQVVYGASRSEWPSGWKS